MTSTQSLTYTYEFLYLYNKECFPRLADNSLKAIHFDRSQYAQLHNAFNFTPPDHAYMLISMTNIENEIQSRNSNVEFTRLTEKH